MAQSEQVKVMATTPMGKIKWFNLAKGDKFGNYSVDLILEDNTETLKFIESIKKVGTGKMPFKQQADGSFIIKLKQKSKGLKKNGQTYEINPPVFYSNAGKKLTLEEVEELSVGNDSIIRAKVELSSYAAMGQVGVSCKPKSVQLVKIVEFGGSGFDAVEFEEIDDIDQSVEHSDDF